VVKDRWFAAVIAVVFLILALVIFLNRDSIFSDEKTAMTREGSEVVSSDSENEARYDNGQIRKKIVSPDQINKESMLSEIGIDSDQLQERVRQFFDYLDRQEYIQAYNLEAGSYQHFLEIAAKLLSHPPVVSGEMKTLYILGCNIAHFYRVMGKKDIVLTKDILSNERELIEPVMAMLYEWGLGEIEVTGGEIHASVGDVYEYAAFFLNTVGGTSYLARRQSGTRMLLTYYSILTIDRANRERLNHYGVDIVPHVDLLIEDIRKYSGLDNKDTYLERLNAIRKSAANRM